MLSNVFGNMVSKGGDGLQSLAMATWQICGGPRRRVAIPENVVHRSGKENGRWRHRHGYGWHRGNCRDATVRERRDGEVIVRHFRRYD